MVIRTSFKKTAALYEQISNLGFIDQIVKMPQYPDEPFIFRYNTKLRNIKEFSDGYEVESTASGFSFESAQLALIKCLVEAVERFSSMLYLKHDIKYGS